MKTLVFLALVTTSALAISPSSLSIILPTVSPTATPDIWWCATNNYAQYFHPPQPTGDLLTAIYSYGDKLSETCTERSCPFPDASKWCAFTTAAPSAILPAYTTYASSASVWWSKQSSPAISIAQECPHHWYDAMKDEPTAASWLNMTIINAECLGAPSPPSPSGSASSAQPQSRITSSSIPSSTASIVTSVVRPTSSAAAEPVSPDGTCGGSMRYVCPGSAFGNCCSGNGWCGSTDAHCKGKCQRKYGICEMLASTSPDGTCGVGQNDNDYTCTNSGFGSCCSASGWCGDTPDHCGVGCQNGRGSCT